MMDLVSFLIDLILHVDVHLESFVRQYGMAVYALLFAIIFVETGLVVMPFLPGDSLLFVVGALSGVGLLSYPLSVLLLITAAVAGNQTNYAFGRWVGGKAYSWQDSKWFNKSAFDKAHAFYERHGAITIVAARFMPFARTFAPFVAGVAQMTRSRFTLFDVTGGTLWVGSIVTSGYFFANLPWVKAHLSHIIWAMIFIPGLIVLLGYFKEKKAAP